MSFYRTHTLTCTPSYTLTCTPSLHTKELLHKDYFSHSLPNPCVLLDAGLPYSRRSFILRTAHKRLLLWVTHAPRRTYASSSPGDTPLDAHTPLLLWATYTPRCTYAFSSLGDIRPGAHTPLFFGRTNASSTGTTHTRHTNDSMPRPTHGPNTS
jgi:hypothetical protein